MLLKNLKLYALNQLKTKILVLAITLGILGSSSYYSMTNAKYSQQISLELKQDQLKNEELKNKIVAVNI
jgi:hypothetical protein